MKLRAMTVTQTTAYIARLIGSDAIMNACSVVGELSSYKQYPSGHVYFNLVDSNAKLPCVMFRRDALQHDLDFKVGDRVKVNGQIRVYEREGRYQLICQRIKHDGAGDLHQRFSELKQALSKMGYFDSARKRSIGDVVRIGLITSSVGAAIEDFTSVLARRNRLIAIDVYPSLVQGSEAAEQLIAGINYFNAHLSVDVIVITRGGGSLEDLWCFNDEKLADAIFNSRIPVVSAVGHETDFTIADFVADLRAPTPSAAAELLSIPLQQIEDDLIKQLKQMNVIISNRLMTARLEVQSNNPQNLLYNIKRRLSDNVLAVNLTVDTMGDKLADKLRYYRQTAVTLNQAIVLQNPRRILDRGYVYLIDCDGKLISSSAQLAVGDDVVVVMKDGKLVTTIKEVIDESTKKIR